MRRRRTFERDLRAGLRGVRAPGEPEAGARVRRRVLAAHAVAPRGRSVRWRRPALAAAAAGILLALVAGGLTAPGQAVGDWLRDVVEREPAGRPARPAVTLPAAGRVLADGGGSLALVARGREPARVGAFRDGTWSPRGRFLAVTTADALQAVTPAGTVRWRVRPPAAPRHPRWSPDGFRLAYLAGPALRVVVGDGTDDRLFYRHARDVAPAFRPTAGRTVAWIDASGHARVADVDRAVLEWRSPEPVPRAHSLAWSADGRALLVAAPRRVVVHDLGTGAIRSLRGRGRVTAAAYPPRKGRPVLLSRRGDRSELRLLGASAPLIETRGRYEGVAWSPDGRWVLTRWADRWLLVRRDGRSARTVPSRGRVLGWVR